MNASNPMSMPQTKTKIASDCVIGSDKNNGTQTVINGHGRLVDKSIVNFNAINNMGSHYVVVIMFYIENGKYTM